MDDWIRYVITTGWEALPREVCALARSRCEGQASAAAGIRAAGESRKPPHRFPSNSRLQLQMGLPTYSASLGEKKKATLLLSYVTQLLGKLTGVEALDIRFLECHHPPPPHLPKLPPLPMRGASWTSAVNI